MLPLTRIYLDHAASTPLDTRVLEAMSPWLDCANPSSQHSDGRRARIAIDAAREQVAALLHCLPGEIVFTSSGTEAVNLAILGTAIANYSSRNRILFASAEHHSVLHTESLLAKLGYKVECVRVDAEARIDIESLRDAISDDVLLVAAMRANNETGAINDIDSIYEIAKSYGALLLCDSIQSPQPNAADLVAYSAHKFYGPKGCGILVVRAGTPLQPIALGGGQERELRAGTENVAAIVGTAVALRHAQEDTESTQTARDEFVTLATKSIPEVQWTCKVNSLPGHAHGSVPGISAESALIVLDRLGVSASSGAACSSGSIEPSHVLIAAGRSREEAMEGIRFSFGRTNTLNEAQMAAERFAEAIEIIRRST